MSYLATKPRSVVCYDIVSESDLTRAARHLQDHLDQQSEVSKVRSIATAQEQSMRD